MDLTRRIDRPELMDTQVFPVDVMRETLNFLGVTTRFFGGAEIVIKHFARWSRTWRAGENIRVLDVGTGGAEIPIALVKWARKAGFKIEVTAIDLVDEVTQVARENTAGIPEILLRQTDLFNLDPAREQFDYVMASLFMHHVRPADGGRLLRMFDALASRGVLVSDLLRSRASYAAVKALSLLIGNAVVRHDAPLSVRRAFHVEELSRLAADAKLPYLKAQREPWFRVSLAGQKKDAPSLPLPLAGEGKPFSKTSFHSPSGEGVGVGF